MRTLLVLTSRTATLLLGAGLLILLLLAFPATALAQTEPVSPASALEQFLDDPTVIGLGVLVGLDILLGITAAFYTRTFRLVLIGDFLRADVLGKLVPYYGVWWALHVGGDVMLGEFGIVEEVTGGAAALAIGASILNSLKELKAPVAKDASEVIAADDPTTPTPPPLPATPG
jgi:hypothetical protein